MISDNNALGFDAPQLRISGHWHGIGFSLFLGCGNGRVLPLPPPPSPQGCSIQGFSWSYFQKPQIQTSLRNENQKQKNVFPPLVLLVGEQWQSPLHPPPKGHLAMMWIWPKSSRMPSSRVAHHPGPFICGLSTNCTMETNVTSTWQPLTHIHWQRVQSLPLCVDVLQSRFLTLMYGWSGPVAIQHLEL